MIGGYDLFWKQGKTKDGRYVGSWYGIVVVVCSCVQMYYVVAGGWDGQMSHSLIQRLPKLPLWIIVQFC